MLHLVGCALWRQPNIFSHQLLPSLYLLNPQTKEFLHNKERTTGDRHMKFRMEHIHILTHYV